MDLKFSDKLLMLIIIAISEKEMRNRTKPSVATITLFILLALFCGNLLPPVEAADISISVGDASIQPDPQFRPDFPDFREYVAQFQKGYQTGTVEYLARQDIYNGWKNYWMAKYIAGELTYKVGATTRSDWTQEEREKTKPERIEEPVGKEDHIEVMSKLTQSAGNPVSLDWRNKNVITSIKDQGSCGSCWTFATAAYGESKLVMQGDADLDINLSEQYLLSCTPDCSCDGGYLEYVFEQASNGVPLESQYPYDPYGIVSPFICWTGTKQTVGYIPNKAYDLTNSELESLLQSGPLAISISASNWEDYKGGIFKCQTYDKINHAVLLIGYDQNSWLIKNQWGEKWGEDGYIRVTKDRLYNCKIGASAFWMWESFNTLSLLGLLLLLTLQL